MPQSVPPTAIVLYRPDCKLLSDLLGACRTSGSPVYAFLNGPVSAEVDRCLSGPPVVRVIRSETNVGQGAGLNVLVHAAVADGADRIFLFDQDTTPEPQILSELCACAVGLERQGVPLAALGPKLVPPAGSGYLPVRYARRPSAIAPISSVEFVDFLPTSGTLLMLSAWREVGPFRADYFIGGIDVEWSFRAWSRGWRCAVSPDLTVDHRWGEDRDETPGQIPTPQILRQSPERIYYYIRNATDALSLPHMPARWKLNQCARLAGQLAVTFAFSRNRALLFRTVARAISDGCAGRLGPVGADLMETS